jgi:hypothetical protein
MSRKSKKKGALKLEAQARAHEALYGGDWREVTEYRKQALRIVTSLGLKLDNGEISAAALKLFAKRLEEYVRGKRKMRGEMPFLRVLRTINEGGVLDFDNETDVRNFRMLENLGYIRQGTLTGKGNKLLQALMSKI